MIRLAGQFDAWHFVFDPEWALAVLLFGAGYLWAAHVMSAPLWRRACFLCGLLVIALALLSPIEHVALDSMLSFHLLQNVMLADWAPPLLVLGLTPAMAAAAERRAWLHAVTHPAFALPYWLAVWYIVHIPAIYGYGLDHRWALGIEHLVFIVTGILFWWAEIVPGRMTAERRIVYLFVALVVMMPLDVFIGLYPEPLYAFYEHTPKLGGISALTDQRIAGATAVLAETLVFAIALLLAALELRSRGRRRS